MKNTLQRQKIGMIELYGVRRRLRYLDGVKKRGRIERKMKKETDRWALKEKIMHGKSAMIEMTCIYTDVFTYCNEQST